MPLFVYKCVKCNHEDEFLIKRDESDAPKQCDQCKGKLEKQISLSSFQLKGGGWYKDLYGSTNNGQSK